jgi:hypothetical protein
LSELSVQQMRASSWRLVPAGVTGGTEGLGVAVGVGDGVDVAAGVGVILRLDAAAPEGEAARSVIARMANAATAERGLIACLTSGACSGAVVAAIAPAPTPYAPTPPRPPAGPAAAPPSPSTALASRRFPHVLGSAHRCSPSDGVTPIYHIEKSA